MGDEIRTVEIDGEPWFVAKDACDALEHSNSRMAVKGLPDRMKAGVRDVYTPSGEQKMQAITEAEEYRLIMRSARLSGIR
ncbi:BRO-N domain-containing protein [Dactylosporangium sp. CA-139114]|uniref:BRO-N domain-containing protein n=1 Tax=Dactylosporangium sp. CA-139114 TaxID=3239931 RepID=UPI003D991704